MESWKERKGKGGDTTLMEADQSLFNARACLFGLLRLSYSSSLCWGWHSELEQMFSEGNKTLSAWELQ